MCLPLQPFKIEKEWKHAGLTCTVVQARETSHRCGYVRVPSTHPFYGKDYDELGDFDAEVHGGLTFAELEPCTDHEDGQGWWFGFDFAHLGDEMLDPNPDYDSLSEEAQKMLLTMRRIRVESHLTVYGRFPGRSEDHFWTQPEVERECENFAEQLAAVTGEPGVLDPNHISPRERARQVMSELKGTGLIDAD
jgi:hypothetical protein